ncbi:MAG TPA: OsmC family peroxiredoxin [Cyclobacteriaceae bacterium]|nr:OsmC family peroxiredoxin [Cyclobacteriaceae bacterium]
MATANSKAQWNGTIKQGSGKMVFSKNEVPYTFASRFENADGCSPEDLIGAAHAGCFSMYLALLLSKEGFTPASIATNAVVILDKDDIGPSITKIALDCKVDCRGLSADKLQELAAITKSKCPVSRLYDGGTAKVDVAVSLT